MHGILQIYPFYFRRMQPCYVTPMCDRPLLWESLDDDRTNPSTGQGGLQVKINPLGVKDHDTYNDSICQNYTLWNDTGKYNTCNAFIKYLYLKLYFLRSARLSREDNNCVNEIISLEIFFLTRGTLLLVEPLHKKDKQTNKLTWLGLQEL